MTTSLPSLLVCFLSVQRTQRQWLPPCPLSQFVFSLCSKHSGNGYLPVLSLSLSSLCVANAAAMASSLPSLLQQLVFALCSKHSGNGYLPALSLRLSSLCVAITAVMATSLPSLLVCFLSVQQTQRQWLPSCHLSQFVFSLCNKHSGNGYLPALSLSLSSLCVANTAAMATSLPSLLVCFLSVQQTQRQWLPPCPLSQFVFSLCSKRSGSGSLAALSLSLSSLCVANTAAMAISLPSLLVYLLSVQQTQHPWLPPCPLSQFVFSLCSKHSGNGHLLALSLSFSSLCVADTPAMATSLPSLLVFLLFVQQTQRQWLLYFPAHYLVLSSLCVADKAAMAPSLPSLLVYLLSVQQTQRQWLPSCHLSQFVFSLCNKHSGNGYLPVLSLSLSSLCVANTAPMATYLPSLLVCLLSVYQHKHSGNGYFPALYLVLSSLCVADKAAIMDLPSLSLSSLFVADKAAMATSLPYLLVFLLFVQQTHRQWLLYFPAHYLVLSSLCLADKAAMASSLPSLLVYLLSVQQTQRQWLPPCPLSQFVFSLCSRQSGNGYLPALSLSLSSLCVADKAALDTSLPSLLDYFCISL